MLPTSVSLNQNSTNTKLLISECYHGHTISGTQGSISVQDVFRYHFQVSCVLLIYDGAKQNG